MISARPIRTMIVDDEPVAREGLRSLLAEDAQLDVVAECGSGSDALAAIRALAPDLVLLDVQMPDLTGLEVLRALSPAQLPEVIFVTAYDRFAIEAFELHAVDYLLKPFADGRAIAALDRAKQRIRGNRIQEQLLGLLNQPAAASQAYPAAVTPTAARPAAISPSDTQPPLRRIALRDRERIRFLETSAITWIEAQGDYVRLHTRTGSRLLRERMGELADRLDPERFVRIHRSAIINVDCLVELHPASHGEFEAVLVGDVRLRVSRSYKRELERWASL